LIHHDSGAVPQVEAALVQVSSKLDLPTGDWPSDKWWLQYDDPQLTALIDRALMASPTIALAVNVWRRLKPGKNWRWRQPGRSLRRAEPSTAGVSLLMDS
jgi:hypothetical protein